MPFNFLICRFCNDLIGSLLDADGMPADRYLERARLSPGIRERPCGFLPGRSIWALETDAANNLWVCYGQINGGLTVIEWPDRDITDYPFSLIFAGTDLLRDLAFDSEGRAWVTTQSEGTIVGQVYVVDPNGTVDDRSDDDYTSFNLANDPSRPPAL